MSALKEIAVLWDAEWRRTLRSGRGVVLLGLYSMFSALVLLVVGSIANAVRAKIDEQVAQLGADTSASAAAFAEARRGVLGFLLSNDTAIVEALSQVPLVVLVVFKVTLFFLPAYVALMGFDQVSGEVGPRSIRFLTLRARRSSILWGKFLAQATVLIGLVLIIDLGIFAYAKYTNPDFGWGALLPALLKFWAAAVVFSLAYLGLTTLCSTLFRSPAVSLVFNLILLFAFWLLDSIGQYHHKVRLAAGGERPAWGELPRFLSPSNYAGNLLHPHAGPFAVSALAYLCFALAFLTTAWAIMRRRDL